MSWRNEGMTSKEKKELKNLISAEIEAEKKTIAELEELTKPTPQDDANDWFTTKESNISKSINEKALQKARMKLISLQSVFPKVDSPNFGMCSRCGQPIPLPRLKALPTTDLCINCAVQ